MALGSMTVSAVALGCSSLWRSPRGLVLDPIAIATLSASMPWYYPWPLVWVWVLSQECDVQFATVDGKVGHEVCIRWFGLQNILITSSPNLHPDKGIAEEEGIS